MNSHMLPHIRFSEFNGEWLKRPLRTFVSKVGSGSTPSGGSKVYREFGVPFIRSQNVSDNKLNMNNVTYITHETHEKMKGSKVQPFDILLNITGGSIGRSCVVPDDFKEGNVNQHVCIIRFQGEIVPEFCQAYLSSYAGQKNLMQNQAGGGREGLNFEAVKDVKLPFTGKKEQQKIADFFSALDKKSSLLKEKHSLLLQYKKGVMQKLLSQEIRFKDENGNDFPEWDKFKLNQVATPIKRRLDQAIETVLTISAKSGFLLQADRFSQIIAGNSLEKYTHLKKGEFSYNRGNSKTYTYGCIYKLEKYEEALVPNIYRSFTLNKGCHDFFAQLFKNRYLDRQLRRLISSSARMDGLLNIGEKDFYEVEVPFPCEEEQKRISTFLNTLDKKIDLVKQKIELTQTFKKGLLRQMFV